MRSRILNRPRMNSWAALMGADICATHGQRQKQLDLAYKAYWDETGEMNRQLEEIECRMAAMLQNQMTVRGAGIGLIEQETST